MTARDAMTAVVRSLPGLVNEAQVTKDSPTIDRLMSRVDEDANGCWIYTGRLDHDGYARIRNGGKAVPCHRFAYEFYIAEIPAGLQLDHLCRVPSCCNPWHLDPVTQSVNLRRGRGGVEWLRKERTECIAGHPFNEANTYLDPRGYRACRVCRKLHARRYRLRRKAA